MGPARRRRWLLVLIVFLLGGVFLSFQRERFEKAGILYDFALLVSTPPQRAIHWVVKNTEDLFHRYVYLLAVQEENERLKRQVEELLQERERLKELAASADRLRKLLRLQKHLGWKSVAAEVIGRSPYPYMRTLIIDKGTVDGVKKGMAVVTSEGVVGHVIEARRSSAIVLLITDRNSSVSVLLRSSRLRGIVDGRGDGLCSLKYLPVREDIREGDEVVTSGMDGVYPKGLLVGRVKSIRREPGGFFLDVDVSPSVDFNRLEEVLILLSPKRRS